MNDTTLTIVLAILAPGGILAVLIERMRRQNNRDHNVNHGLLSRIDKKLDKVDDRLHDHITDRSAHP
jgi:hypothetical protein